MKTETQTASAAASAQPQMIPIGQIVPDPKNRKEHNPEALDALADSIKIDGLLQAIVVRPIEGGKFMIIAGERRWRAHQLLNLKEVLSRVIENETELKSVRKRIAENRFREGLTPIEEAQGFQDLLDTGMSQSEVATFVGEAQSTVANQLRLLKLPPSVKKDLHEGILSRAHGVALARFSKWPKVVAKMADCAINEGTSAKELERDELPFEWELDRAKLLMHLKPYYGYVATEEMKKDADWLCFSGGLYCFDLEKGMAEKVRQDAEISKKAAKKAAGDKSTGGSKMTAAEKAERVRTIAKNAAQRSLIASSLVQATIKIKQSQDDACKVLLMEAFGWKYAARVASAAETLGIKLPDTLKRSQTGPGGNLSGQRLIEALGLPSALKIAAEAIAIVQSEDAARNACSVPDAVAFIAGKVKPSVQEKKAPTPKVSARNKKGGKDA
jgi:ParB/RepB/Spo0J family partition protein